MALILYNLLLPVLVLALLPGYLQRMRKRGNFRRNFGQRLGVFSPEMKERLAARDDWVWVRAVSVGEMVAAEKVIRQMKAQNPDLAVVLSTTTSTGFAVAEQRFADAQGDWLEIIYSPLDFAVMVWRALRLIRPRLIVFIESEIWPNLAWMAHTTGVKLALINSRMSPRSAGRFRRFGRLGRSIFRLLNLVTIQEEEHREIWEHLGVAPERIHRAGALKLDFADDEIAAAQDRGEFGELLEQTLGWAEDDSVLMGGSTAPGEELILARIFQDLKPAHPRLRLLLAPRHVERTPEILRELARLNLPAARRSLLDPAAPEPDPNQPSADVLLLDTTGELARWYSVASLVFIGKSLLPPGGGQNPVEALAAGKPVLFGPHMQNQRWISSKMCDAGAAIEVEDEEDLRRKISDFLDNPGQQDDFVTRGQAFLQQVRGASRENARLLSVFFSKTPE